MFLQNNLYTSEEIIKLSTQKMIIYKITNLINDKVYIGQTTRTFNQRYKGNGIGAERVRLAKNSNQHLLASLEKYGANNFKVDIIEVCNSVEELNKRECFYIDFYDSTNSEKGYNHCQGGNGGKRVPTNKELKKRLLKRHKNTSERTLEAYLRKMEKVGLNQNRVLKEILTTPIFVKYENGEITSYESISIFLVKSKPKHKMQVTKLHYLFKQRRGEVPSGLYKVNDQPYTIYLETDTSLPSDVLKIKEQRLIKQIKNSERKQEREKVVSIITSTFQKYGEWEEWVDYNHYNHSGWIVQDETMQKVAEEEIKTRIMEEVPQYLSEEELKYENSLLLWVLIRRFYRKIYG